MKREDTFREFIRQFFKPHTRLSPSAVSQEAGFSNSQLIAFLLPEGNSARRGLPRASTLAALARVLRKKLLERARTDLARQCTVIRFFIEAGYLMPGDVAEFLEVEGCPGWVKAQVILNVLEMPEGALEEVVRTCQALMPVIGTELAGEPEPAR